MARRAADRTSWGNSFRPTPDRPYRLPPTSETTGRTRSGAHGFDDPGQRRRQGDVADHREQQYAKASDRSLPRNASRTCRHHAEHYRRKVKYQGGVRDRFRSVPIGPVGVSHIRFSLCCSATQPADRKYNRVRRLILHGSFAVSMSSAPPSGVLGPPGPPPSARSVHEQSHSAGSAPAGRTRGADGKPHLRARGIRPPSQQDPPMVARATAGQSGE